jgi:hypothetical protein
MPLAQNPSTLPFSNARAALTPKLVPAPCAPGIGAIVTASRSASMPASARRHALRLCAQELDVAPLGKTGDEEVSRTTDELQAAVAHGRERMLDRHDQFQGDVEPLAFEEAKLNGRNRGEIGVRDQVGHRELHRRSLWANAPLRPCPMNEPDLP